MATLISLNMPVMNDGIDGYVEFTKVAPLIKEVPNVDDPRFATRNAKDFAHYEKVMSDRVAALAKRNAERLAESNLDPGGWAARGEPSSTSFAVFLSNRQLFLLGKHDLLVLFVGQATISGNSAKPYTEPICEMLLDTIRQAYPHKCWNKIK